MLHLSVLCWLGLLIKVSKSSIDYKGCPGFTEYSSVSEYRLNNPDRLQDTYSKRVNLTEPAKNDGAVCIDGSVPVFYWRPGTDDGTSKFIIYFDGGGWCGGIDGDKISPCQDTCAHRAYTQFGTSNDYRDILDTDTGCMSTDKAINPVSYNWNTILMRYCDGSSFSGNNETVVRVNASLSLHFRGWRILNGLFRSLINDYKLGDATDVIVGGCSAGGLNMYMHLDYIHANFVPKTANFMGLIDSGFFMKYEGEGKYISAMQWIWDNMNVTDGMNEKCMEHYADGNDGGQFQCMFAQNISPFIDVKVFNMQSRYDAWQDTCELMGHLDTEVNEYGSNLTDAFKQNWEMSNTDLHGAFLDSCFRHCDNGGYYNITIDGYTQAQAEFDFYYETNNTHSNVWFQDQPYPCTDCCP